MSRDDGWLLDMLQASRQALAYAEGIEEQAFLADNLRQDAILRQLLILGEACKRVSPEFKAKHPEIPWKGVAGFRDVVVHDYADVDAKEVWRILRTNLPELINALAPLVPPP